AAENPAAAPSDMTPQTDEKVEKGKYLAAAGNCISCHTRKGGEEFAGGLEFHSPVGSIHSTNITPDAETGIGKWSEDDFIKAMHDGVAPGGRHLFPAFPYTAFTKVTDDDVKAIYAYLKTVKPVKYTPPSNGIMFNSVSRLGMIFWNALFHTSERYKTDTTQSAEWNRGAYLVEGLGHCSACHSPRNIFLAEDRSQAYAGGEILDHVGAPDAEPKIRKWAGVNLTPAKTGLGAWSADDIAKYLNKGFVISHAGTWGPMTEVIVNSMRHLSVEDTKAMAVYIKSLPPKELPGGTPISEDQAKAGQTVYKDRCAKCHQDSGRGGMFNAPPLVGSVIVQHADPASLINIIIYGANAPKEISTGQWETMKPLGEVMTDAEIAAVSNYIRSSWGNVGRAVQAADVAKQR
ncbi:MAG: cytochrome c, partial [Rhodospirillaceae bacterium]|nr:cytochrome c [Rhodospirillaceae bacterium]